MVAEFKDKFMSKKHKLRELKYTCTPAGYCLLACLEPRDNLFYFVLLSRPTKLALSSLLAGWTKKQRLGDRNRARLYLHGCLLLYYAWGGCFTIEGDCWIDGRKEVLHNESKAHQDNLPVLDDILLLALL